MSSSEYEGSVPPLGDDIPEEDWNAANESAEDGVTGTDQEEDADDFETDDEQPVEDEVGLLAMRSIQFQPPIKQSLLSRQAASRHGRDHKGLACPPVADRGR